MPSDSHGPKSRHPELSGRDPFCESMFIIGR
jgi:hypothetical protein